MPLRSGRIEQPIYKRSALIMWVAVALIVIALLMIAFMPKPGVENARAAKLGDFQIPRSKYGDPMPLIWGTVRQKSPIIAWFGDFRPVPIKKKMSSGLFGSKSVIVGYKNYVGIDCVLALGPGVVLKRFWAGTYLVWTGNATGVTDILIDKPDLFGGEEERGGLKGTITFYDGRFNPPRDSYLASVLDPNVPAYNGLARALFKSFYIGTTTNLEMFSFEVSRLTSGLHPTYSIMPNGLDVNPMEICFDMMTQKWGRFGNLQATLDLPSFIAAAQTLYNEGLGMSIAAQTAITGKDMLEEIMRLCDGLLYQDPATSKIVAKLIRNDYVFADLPVLDESIIKELKGFSKTTWESTLNQCRVTFKDRAGDYDDSVAIAQDFANINYQNRVKSTEIASPGCTTATVANKLANRQLSLLSVPLYKCNIVCSRKVAQKLRPGSVFRLNWKPFNLVNMVMRISKIDFGELTSGQIKITCIQDRFATATPTFAPPDVTEWLPTNTNASVVSLNRIFTPPYFLSRISDAEGLNSFDTQGRLYVLAVPPSNASISFDSMFGLTNFPSNPVASIEAAPYGGGGTLSAAYSDTVADASRNDTSSLFKVQGVSASTIAQLSQYSTLTQARDGSALILVNNELFVYVGFVDNGDNSVTFPNIYRSVLDTEPASHAAGDRVWFINSNDGLLSQLITNGSTAFNKLLDTTTSAKLSISLAPTVSAVQDGRARLPLPPQYLTLQGSRTPAPGVALTSVTATWRLRTRGDAALKVYDDGSATIEAGTQTRVRWRVGSGGYTTVVLTGTSTSLNVTGLTGVLEVLVDTQIISSGLYSTVSDRLTMTLT
ncbi:hypothetical protein [Pseudomonas phage KP1]|uniref:Tip attachment protein J domain-containing protein n=1 Tax=Pseudomonas phage KP1 TaxID=2562463 RepID=A0A6G5QAI2_9CAUD|nr:tail protein [Pseudomonas phage KP1]QBZ71733.1 hypothetical protein [Pseudomonas phage KP1]